MASEPPVVPIIGGGPAGMSCALWLHNYGLYPIIIEKESALGGMARMSPYPNEWLLGQRGKTARENAAEFAAHIRGLGIETWLGTTPHRLHRENYVRWRLDASGAAAARSLLGPAIVIATGTRFAGEEWVDGVKNARRMAAAGRLHLGASAVGEPGADLGSHVAVIGGGDNAFDVSRMLAEKGVRVSVLMRSQSPRAQPVLVERLRLYQISGLVQVISGRTVEALHDAGSGVKVRLNGGGEIEA
ncbi:MAG: NAD(P)/FAD-dependent oxidoreductase, partial [Alphaproteobacteria bacterium]